jgi:hypothetical protein
MAGPPVIAFSIFQSATTIQDYNGILMQVFDSDRCKRILKDPMTGIGRQAKIIGPDQFKARRSWLGTCRHPHSNVIVGLLSVKAGL